MTAPRESRNSLSVLVLKAVGLLTALLARNSSPECRLQLAASSAGRVALHVVCCWKDHRFRWHWQGIRREFNPALSSQPKQRQARTQIHLRNCNAPSAPSQQFLSSRREAERQT